MRYVEAVGVIVGCFMTNCPYLPVTETMPKALDIPGMREALERCAARALASARQCAGLKWHVVPRRYRATVDFPEEWLSVTPEASPCTNEPFQSATPLSASSMLRPEPSGDKEYLDELQMTSSGYTILLFLVASGNSFPCWVLHGLAG